MSSVDCAPPNVAIGDIYFGWFLIIGTFLSFLPQYIEIVYKKSSNGISWIWQFVGNINQFSQFMNGFILQFHNILCCTELGLNVCSSGLLPIYQLFSQWIAFFPLYLFYLIYFDTKGDKVKEKDLKNASLVFYFLTFITLFCIALAIVFIITIGSNAWVTSLYAYTLGIISSIMTIIQSAPQIYVTIKSKSKGSLSLLMLIITAIGMLMVTIFFIIRGENISTWMPNLLGAVQQSILLSICMTYSIRDWRRNNLKIYEKINI